MQVKHSAIHKLTVEGSCGCMVAGEFSDAAYKAKIGETVFKACATHEGKDGVEMLADILSQALDREAKEYKLPEPVHRVNPVRPAPSEGGTEGAAVTRTGPPKRELSPLKSTRVVGAGGGGVRRVDPSAMVARRTAGGLKTAASVPSKQTATRPGSGPAPLEMDIDAAPEDPRLTKLLEKEGLASILDETDDSMRDDTDFDDGGDEDSLFD